MLWGIDVSRWQLNVDCYQFKSICTDCVNYITPADPSLGQPVKRKLVGAAETILFNRWLSLRLLLLALNLGLHQKLIFQFDYYNKP